MMSPSLPLLARSAGTAPGLPQSAERELRFPNAGSQTKCTMTRGESSPPPKSLLAVRPLGAGGSKVQKPASENHRSSPEHIPGRSAHVQNRAMLGVSRPSDGSSRAAR
ncbi:hypothetical protein NDU88_001947 [Pleurodeles waltl]|uniref:Uncharacterized protein n=1 Tax=Pleurodeles waltl TaxID=8319 RepID=A0AAV7LZ33_PLEWA|nr:hypothetical protein NDU88_001947 [Pleurodeles waltl]